MRLDRDAARILAEDLAAAMRYAPYAERLDPVADAIADGRPQSRIDKLARTAAAAAWGDGLRAEAEVELDRLEADTRAALVRIEAARSELGRPVTDNRLAAALVEQLAADHLDAVVAVGMHLEELDEELQYAPADERRGIALRVVEEIGLPDVSEEEGRRAASAMLGAAHAARGEDALVESIRTMARSLATDERRHETRQSLATLMSFAREEVPTLAEAVDELLGEPIPEDPTDDPIWMATVVHAVTGSRGEF